MKTLICGHGRHGKDSVADLLNKFNRMTASSSSYFVMSKLAEKICSDLGYTTLQECVEKRSLHRAYLYNLIRDYNSPDKARLSKEILTEHDIYIGMRDLEEFNASKNLFDLLIWVDASERLPIESEQSFNIPKKYFDIVIENNGTFEELQEKVKKLSSAFLW